MFHRLAHAGIIRQGAEGLKPGGTALQFVVNHVSLTVHNGENSGRKACFCSKVLSFVILFSALSELLNKLVLNIIVYTNLSYFLEMKNLRSVGKFFNLQFIPGERSGTLRDSDREKQTEYIEHGLYVYFLLIFPK